MVAKIDKTKQPDPPDPNDPEPKYRPKLPPLDYEWEGKRLAHAGRALDFIQKYIENWLDCPDHFKVYDLRQLALAQAALVHARRELHKLDCEVRQSEREAIQKVKGTDPNRLIKRTYQILGIPELFAEYMTGEKTPPEPKGNEVNIWCHDLIPPGQEYLYPQYYPGRDFSKERAAAEAQKAAAAKAEEAQAEDPKAEDPHREAPQADSPQEDSPHSPDPHPTAPQPATPNPENPSADSASASDSFGPCTAQVQPSDLPAVPPNPPAPSAPSPRPKTRSADDLPEGIIRMPSEPRFFPNSTFPYVGSNYRDIRRHPLKPSEQPKPEQSGNPPQTGNPNQDPSEPQP